MTVDAASTGNRVRVRIVSQSDPGGGVAGGVDSVIRGIAKFAPPDIDVSVVGLTMDPVSRPVGRWTNVQVGRRSVPYYPVGEMGPPMHRGPIPHSVRLAAGIVRHRSAVCADCDVFDFHRIEPAIPLLGSRQARHLFVHQNMEVLRNAKSDIGWRHLPGLYFHLESRVLPRFANIFCVRQDAAEAYRTRYPAIADRVRFLPTWMDPEVFCPVPPDVRASLRRRIGGELSISDASKWVIFVGRLDRQKDPLLMVETLAVASRQRPDLSGIVVGAGVMREEVEAALARAGLGARVRLVGARPPEEVARYLQASDVYLMSSAYEGMPISVLEALATGLPVVSTNVGEVGRVVRTGVSGALVDAHEAGPLAEAIDAVLGQAPGPLRQGAIDSVSPFVPDRVLADVFESYRISARR